jgi:hypothetical protein
MRNESEGIAEKPDKKVEIQKEKEYLDDIFDL